MKSKNKVEISRPDNPQQQLGIGIVGDGPGLARLAAAIRSKCRSDGVLMLCPWPDVAAGFADRLRQDCAVPVVLADDGDPAAVGPIYLVPPGRGIALASGRFRKHPAGEIIESTAVDAFLKSLADEFGPRALAVILPGGEAPAGCRAVRAAGGRVWFQMSADEGGMSPPLPFHLADAIVGPEHLAHDLNRLCSPSEPASRDAWPFLDALPHPACIATADGAALALNRAFSEWTGASAEHLLGLGWHGFVHTDEQTRLADAWRDAATTGVGFALTCRLRRLDGSWNWSELQAEPVDAGTPARRHWLVSATDIQELHDLRTALAASEQRFITHSRDRAAMETALRSSESRYRSLAEHSSDWIWEVDVDGVFTYASPKVRDILGYEPEEIVGRTPFDLMPAAEVNRFRALFTPIWNQRRLLNRYENVNLHKDGSAVTVESTALPFFDDEGRFCGYRGLDRDISQRRWMEDDLRESAAQSQAILDSMLAQISVLDRYGNVVAVNEPWRRFCLERGEVEDVLPQLTGIGTNYLEVCRASESISDGLFGDRSSARRARDGVQDVLEGRLQSFSLEFHRPGLQGERWFLLTASPLKTAKGGAVVAHTEITERKLAEQALAEASERKRLLFDEIGDGIMIFDAELRLVEANPACAGMLGYTQEELRSLRPWDWDVRWPSRHAFLERFPVSSVKPEKVETIHRRRDGSTYDAEVSLQPAHWRAEQMLFLVARDISSRKAAERARLETEARFRSLVNNASDAFFLARTDGRIVEVNRSACAMLGYRREELLHLGLCDIECALRHEQIAETLAQVGAGKPQTVIGRHRRKDGSTFPVEGRISYGEIQGQPMYLALIRDISERVAAEARLRESERRLRSFFDTPVMGIAILRPDSTWLDANGRLCALCGYTREELFTLDWRDLTHPDDLLPDLEQFGRLMAGDIDEYSLEKRFFRQDGSVVYTSMNVGCVREPDGAVSYLVAFIQDIGERRQMEQQIRKLSLAVEQSPESIVVTDTQGCIEYVNEAFVRSTGYARDEILGRNPRILQSGNTSRGTYEALWSALRRGESWEGEFVNRRRNGETYIEHEIFWPVRERDGRISHFLAIKQDITERKRLEAELDGYRQQLEHLVEERTRQLQLANRDLEQQAAEIRDLYENAPCGYHSLRADGSILAINATELALLGYEREEIVGLNYRDLVGPEYRAAFDHGRERLMAGEAIHDLELELIARDGSRLPVLLNATAVSDRSGRFLHDRGTLFDHRERRRHDRQIASLHGELARRAEEADAANATKSEFLANMSHEIRTPLNAIRLSLELLSATALDEHQRYHLAKFDAALEGLVGIIDDVLDFSRIEAGVLKIETAELDLERVMDRVGILLAERADEKGLQLLYDAAWDLPRIVRGDPLRLSQILINLVGNAIKFSERGTVLVSFRELERSGGHLVLECLVRDEGIGISREHREHLFTPFFQADTSITRKYGGTGLGLAICLRLVELMDGTLDLESEPGLGSLFRFTLQLGLPDETPPLPFPPLPAAVGRRSVVIDRNPEVRRVLTAQLSALGLAVEAHADLPSAMAALEPRPGSLPPVLLIDFLPEESAAVLELAAAAGHGELAPIVHLTSSSHRCETGLHRDGTLRELRKPLTRLRLRQCLESLLANGSLPAAAEDSATRLARQLHGADILVVEDNTVNRDLLSEVLRGLGLRVRLAGNGLEALAAVEAAVPDAVLMDCQMPVMDGYETSRRLRQQERCRDLPIIALTAHALPSDRDRCLEAGMTAHLSKPFEILKLMNILTRFVVPPDPANSIAPAPASVPPAEEIPELPGLDVKAGLARVSGKRELYLRLLRKFRDAHLSTFAADFQQAAASDDWATANRLAHSLKGTARTLGADALGDAAAELEAMAKLPERKAMAGPLDRVMEEIRKLTDVLGRLG